MEVSAKWQPSERPDYILRLYQITWFAGCGSVCLSFPHSEEGQDKRSKSEASLATH